MTTDDTRVGGFSASELRSRITIELASHKNKKAGTPAFAFQTPTIPYAAGAFCAADAMFAPVVTRLDTYQVPVATETRQYMNAVLSHPAFVKWRNEALAEPWGVPHYEDGWTAVETYHQPSITVVHRPG